MRQSSLLSLSVASEDLRTCEDNDEGFFIGYIHTGILFCNDSGM